MRAGPGLRVWVLRLPAGRGLIRVPGGGLLCRKLCGGCSRAGRAAASLSLSLRVWHRGPGQAAGASLRGGGSQPQRGVARWADSNANPGRLTPDNAFQRQARAIQPRVDSNPGSGGGAGTLFTPPGAHGAG